MESAGSQERMAWQDGVAEEKHLCDLATRKQRVKGGLRKEDINFPVRPRSDQTLPPNSKSVIAPPIIKAPPYEHLRP